MTTTVQARVDDELKTQAERVFHAVGLDLSTAIRMFLAAAVRERGLPFEARDRWLVIEGETFDITEADLAAAMTDAKRGVNLHGPFHSADDMFAALEA
jgi:DNA-damage-inducible protein J